MKEFKKYKKYISIGLFVCILFSLNMLLILKISRNSTDNITIENKKASLLKDSLAMISCDMAEIVECIYLNQGFQLPKNVVFRKALDNSISTIFEKKTIFAYISPLACWSCVKTINGHLSDYFDKCNIVYLIPENLSSEIQTFLDYTKIPKNKVYYISTNLGLPIEDNYRLFLFSLGENNTIIDVFPPTKYSKYITEAYINSIINN